MTAENLERKLGEAAEAEAAQRAWAEDQAKSVVGQGWFRQHVCV